MARKLKTSTEGYKSTSQDRNNAMNLIPSGNITMRGVPHNVLGIDEFGNKQMMYPNQDYQFPGNSVLEIPMKEEFKKGGAKKTTHKNIKTSRNKLMERNYDIYGEVGTKEYKPLFEDGGFTDNFLKKTIAQHTENMTKKAPKQNDFQSVTTNDYIAKQKDEFTAYLQRNAMNHMVQEEQQFLTQKPVMNFMRMGGASGLSAFIPKAQMGQQTGPYAGLSREEQIQQMLQLNGNNTPQQYPVNPADFQTNPVGYYSPFATMGNPNTTPQYGPNQTPSNPPDFNTLPQMNSTGPSTSFVEDYQLGQNQLNTPLTMSPPNRNDNYDFQGQVGNDALNSGAPYADGTFDYKYGIGQQSNPVATNGTPWTYDMNNPNAPTGNQAYNYNPIMMPNEQTQNQQISSYVSDDQLYNSKNNTNQKPNYWNNMAGVDKANLLVTGANTISSLLEKAAANKRQKELEKLLTADNTFAVRPASSASRGDYDTNSGVLRPDKYVPVQFGAYGKQNAFSGAYKQGGQHNIGDEIEMSDFQLAQFLAAGGQVEYL